jgi:beta-N-acetylhexosaminidase
MEKRRNDCILQPLLLKSESQKSRRHTSYGDISAAAVKKYELMGAITQQYTSAEAAVGSILAGVDIVLGPQNLVEAFDAVMAAVNNGTIREERINQSVRRILKLKMK